MRLQWPGLSETGATIITVDPKMFCLAEGEIDVSGEIFSPKQELHVTLIGEKVRSSLQDKIEQDPSVEVLLKKIFEEIDWSFEQTGPVHILSRLKDNIIQKSIILLIEMPGVAAFYQRLKSLGLIATNTPVPPAHVTMYTFNCPLGIGVASCEELNTLSQKTLSVNTLNKLAAAN